MNTNVTSYYDESARRYDQMHGDAQDPEHLTALRLAWPIIQPLGVESVLDVGCGTGRALRWLDQNYPGTRLVGVEPSAQMIEVAKQKVPAADLRQGAAEKLLFEDNAVDVAIATGVLHHVDDPAVAVLEMGRVARRALLISDHNNFAFGGAMARRVRLLMYATGTLKVFQFVKQGFRRQGYTPEDGWWYPFSMFNIYAQVAKISQEIYVIATRPVRSSDRLTNLLLTQTHATYVCILR